MPLLRRLRFVDAFNNGLDKLVIQVDPVTDFNAEAFVPVDVTGTPLGTNANPMVTSGGAGSPGGPPATATAAAPTYVEGAGVPLSVDLNGSLRTLGGGGASGPVDVSDRVGRLVGHVTVDNASIPVTGVFWQATQPVSAAALPLPTGAATDASLTATQPRDVTDRAARLLGHVTVDNASIPVTGTFWQATQPVSGTVGVSNFPDKVGLTPAAPAAASVGVSSAQALGANANRKGLVLTNTSANAISLGLGATAVLNSGITLNPSGGVWVMDQYTFTTGVINAIAGGAASNLAIQEFS